VQPSDIDSVELMEGTKRLFNFFGDLASCLTFEQKREQRLKESILVAVEEMASLCEESIG
jgi:hypothetical protein